jgi:hypothetical protein
MVFVKHGCKSWTLIPDNLSRKMQFNYFYFRETSQFQYKLKSSDERILINQETNISGNVERIFINNNYLRY